jgi:hypothetical protein
METVRLIYSSRAFRHLDSREINVIQECSHRLNSYCGVTGILYFSNNYFLQYLEGNETDVDRTYERITKDQRHTDLKLVDHGAIKCRHFSEWAMAYVPESDKISTFLNKYTNDDRFNPHLLSAATTVELIFELRSFLPDAHYDGAL